MHPDYMDRPSDPGVKTFGALVILITVFHCFAPISNFLSVLYSLLQFLFLLLAGYELLIPYRHTDSYIEAVLRDTIVLLIPQILIWIILPNADRNETNLLAAIYFIRLAFALLHILFSHSGHSMSKKITWIVMGTAGFFGMIAGLLYIIVGIHISWRVISILFAFLPAVCGNMLRHTLYPSTRKTDIQHTNPHLDNEHMPSISVLHDLHISCIQHPLLYLLAIQIDPLLITEWQMKNSVLSALIRICLDLSLVIIVILSKELFMNTKNTRIQNGHRTCRRYFRASSVFYYVTFGVAMFRLTLRTTMFPNVLNSAVTNFIASFSLVLLNMSILAFAVALVTVRNRAQMLFELIILIVFFIWHSIVPSSLVILYLIALVLGATGRNFRTILKIYLGVKIPILAGAFFASQHGYIYNKIVSGYNAIGRHSLGIINSTDCAAHVLFLLIAFCLLKRRGKNWKSFIIYPILLLLIEYCYHLTGARSDMIWMLITVSFSLLFHILSLRQWSEQCQTVFRTFCFILTPSYLILLWITYIAVITYGTGKGPFAFVTSHLTDTGLIQRLEIPQKAIANYGITLFGCSNTYPDIGYGGRSSQWKKINYSYIDISYMRMLILYGILITVVLMSILLFMNIRYVLKREYYLFGILVLVALTGLVEQHLSEVQYNMLILAAFSQYSSLEDYREQT